MRAINVSWNREFLVMKPFPSGKYTGPVEFGTELSQTFHEILTDFFF